MRQKVLDTAPVGFSKIKLNYGPYSPSRLITAKCPSRFFGEYIRKDKVIGSSLAAARGSAIHDILELITTYNIEGKNISHKQLNEWISDAIGRYPAAYPQVDLIKAAAEAYIANPSPYANKSTMCEKSFAVQVWQEDSFDTESYLQKVFVKAEYDRKTRGGDFFFGGHIDQMSIDEDTKIITILDHKSTPTSSKNEDYTFQVGAYAWLVSLFYPGYKIRTVIHYAHPSLNFYGVPDYWSEEELMEIEGYIFSAIGSIEKMEDFVSIPGTGCDYCHMIQECSLYQKVREQKSKGMLDLNVHSVDDLIRLAKELHVIDSISSEITKVLKQGINTLCPTTGINIGGITYGNKTSEESVDWEATSKKISEESIKAKTSCEEGNFKSEEERIFSEKISRCGSLDDLLKIHGLNPDLFKQYNNQKMKNVWRLDKENLIEDLKKVIVKKRDTKFGAHKNF